MKQIDPAGPVPRTFFEQPRELLNLSESVVHRINVSGDNRDVLLDHSPESVARGFAKAESSGQKPD
jgi:hypothetical protein